MTQAAVGLTTELESRGESRFQFEFPKHLEHPAGRAMLTAAYLLEHWANTGAIPRYDGVIDALRDGAGDIFKAAKPIRSNTMLRDVAKDESNHGDN